jgi:hypothetical protein
MKLTVIHDSSRYPDAEARPLLSWFEEARRWNHQSFLHSDTEANTTSDIPPGTRWALRLVVANETASDSDDETLGEIHGTI